MGENDKFNGGLRLDRLPIDITLIVYTLWPVIVTWDEPKRLSNIEKHGIDFADIGEAFFTSSIIAPAKEGRFRALGWFGGIVIVVIFAQLGAEAFTIISARPADRKERKFANARPA